MRYRAFIYGLWIPWPVILMLWWFTYHNERSHRAFVFANVWYTCQFILTLIVSIVLWRKK